jgi:hypothetical protein
MKPLFCFLFSGLCLAAANLPAAEEKAPAAAPVSLPSLDTLTEKETVDIFASMPVQEQGRVKPLDTLARFRLLRFSGKQSGIAATDSGSTVAGMGQPKPVPLTDAATGKPILTAEGKPRKFSAIEWLLVSWFRPDIGKNLPVFVVDNSDAVIELGLGGKGKRDRYSFNEIVPGRPVLVDKWNELRTKQMEARKEHRDVDMTPEERALSKLAVDFLDYEMMLGHFEFAGPLFAGSASSLPAPLAALVKDGTVTNWAAFLPALSAQLKDPSAGPPMQNPWMRDYVKAMLGAVMSGDEAAALHNFPPPVGKADAWHGPGDILQTAMTGGDVTREDIAQLTDYAALYKAAHDPASFKSQAKKLRDEVQVLGNARGESGHVGLELHYHRTDYFYKALLCFTFGLVLLALSWVKRGAAW